MARTHPDVTYAPKGARIDPSTVALVASDSSIASVRSLSCYQHSRAGRFNHALRMRHWRARRATQMQVVTHPGSQPTPVNTVLTAIDPPLSNGVSEFDNRTKLHENTNRSYLNPLKPKTCRCRPITAYLVSPPTPLASWQGSRY